MSVDAVTVASTFFQPIRVTEDILEGLIRTAAPALFPGYDYFDFRPAIRCGAGTRHPDGVLLATDNATWWVVEVESHFHSVAEHIEPQLRDLASGFYGPDEYRFLKRHQTFEATNYQINVYEPSFLLVIDSLTPEVRDAAARTGFEVLECSPFRSDQNQWALTVSGFRPRRYVATHGPGLDLHLGEEDGQAVLYPVDGGKVPRLPSRDVILADAVYPSFVRRDRRGIVLSLTATEVRGLLDAADHYRLTSSGQLVAITPDVTTILVKE